MCGGRGWEEGQQLCSIFTDQLLWPIVFIASPLSAPYSLRSSARHRPAQLPESERGKQLQPRTADLS